VLLVERNARLALHFEKLARALGVDAHGISSVEEAQVWTSSVKMFSFVWFARGSDESILVELKRFHHVEVRTFGHPIFSEHLEGAFREPEGQPDTSPEVASSQPSTTSRSLRVLVAEDNPVNQKIIVRFLEKLGHTPITVGDGQRAVVAADAELPDAILMDVQMPMMDGLEATRLIRARERGEGRHVPIIALTAHAMQGDEERCLAAGMDGHLTKPIDRALLAAALDRIASGSPEQHKDA
jgi:CheY-like chemotaxis protein